MARDAEGDGATAWADGAEAGADPATPMAGPASPGTTPASTRVGRSGVRGRGHGSRPRLRRGGCRAGALRLDGWSYAR